MKVTYRLGIKLPVEGVQFSNIEQAVEWEIEGEDADEILEGLKDKIEDFMDEQMDAVGGRIKNTIQELNTRLEKARLAFVNSKKGDDNGTYN